MVFVESILSHFDFVEAAVAFGVNGEAERFESLEVRFDGAGAERAAASVGDSKLRVAVQQRAEEHDNRTGSSGCLNVHFI